MTSVNIILLIEIEEMVAVDHATPSVDNDDKQGIEPPRAYEDLIIAIKRIPIHVMSVVDAGQAEAIKRQLLNILPNICLWVWLGCDIPHRGRRAFPKLPISGEPSPRVVISLQG